MDDREAAQGIIGAQKTASKYWKDEFRRRTWFVKQLKGRGSWSSSKDIIKSKMIGAQKIWNLSRDLTSFARTLLNNDHGDRFVYEDVVDDEKEDDEEEEEEEEEQELHVGN